MTNYKTITIDVKDGIALLTLNKPERMNAIGVEMVKEITDACIDLESNPDARVLLITGAGRGFCSGADLQVGGVAGEENKPVDAGAALETDYNPMLERLMALRMPIITAVNGAAAGAGCSLALAGDIVLAGKSAYFLQAFVNIGLVPDVGSTWMLPRLIGRCRASAMMMLGERILADRALEWGMVYAVHDDDKLVEEATAIAARLAKGPTVSLQLIRSGIRQSLETSLTESLRIERVNQAAAGATSDFKEGVTAFLEKRPAQFQGK